MEFQPEKETWQSYTQRLEHFFIATKAVEDDQKVTALITANDPSFYTLLTELSFPINPKTMTFDDVMSTLGRHYVGIKNIFRERKLFYNAVIGPNESVSEWYRRLKSLAIDCDFGILLEEVLIDKFVCGFEGKILQRFYEQDESLNLIDALKIAQLHQMNKESIEECESDDLWEDQDDDNESIEECESDDLWEDQDDDNESIEECESDDLWEDQDDEASEYESIDVTEEPTESSTSYQQLLKLPQEICSQGYHLLNNIFTSQAQQQRRIVSQRKPMRSPHHQGVERQRQRPQQKQISKQQKPVQTQNSNQKQDLPKKQKQPQSRQPVQKQNNQQHQPNQLNHPQAKFQQKQSSQKPTTSQKSQKQNNQQHQTNHQQVKLPHQQPSQKPRTSQKPQKQNVQQHQPNHQQVKFPHQQPSQKPRPSQKPSMTLKPVDQYQIKKQQPREQQQSQSQSVPKSRNHQQKPQPQKSQTIQKTTTIITKKIIKTASTTVTNPNKGPNKCHKCGKVGHNANVCNSK